jgi:eukaryotic-like serine/threonine-protein kinase
LSGIDAFDSNQVIGTTLGSATILRELARGSMGVVLAAYQQSLKRRIAVKLLPKSMYTAESIRLFEQEAEAVAGLSHPNIVPIYEIGETRDFRWFTMQLIEGESLAAMLWKTALNPVPSRRTLPTRTALAMARQILGALGYAHRRHVVHRDIKPENILVTAESHIPVITDFGISRIVSAKADAMTTARGSPLYMAPEQILSPEIDARADIYAAGVLLFRLLVETLPLIAHQSADALLAAKVSGRTIFTCTPSQANPRLHRDMDALVARATAQEPSDRYDSCRDFLAALEEYGRRHLGPH